MIATWSAMNDEPLSTVFRIMLIKQATPCLTHSYSPIQGGDFMTVRECFLYVGTEDGVLVYSLSPDYSLKLIGRGLAGNAVRGIAIHHENPRIAYIACGLRGWGLHVTRDAGKTFTSVGFNDRWVWDVAFAPDDPQTIWVGTEPPMIHVSRDGGITFQAHEQIDRLSSRNRWHFFHPPFHAGHVHGIAVHPAEPLRIFAGVEQGGLIFTHDGGNTWHDALPGYDLHRIAIDPSDPDHILAGAGEGLFVSKDAGWTWNAVESMKGKHIHTILYDPRNPNRCYVYADDPECPVYRSEDGGSTWRPSGLGLPPAKPADSLVLHPSDSGVLIYGGDQGNRKSGLYLSTDGGESWRCILDQLPKIWRLKVAPVQELSE
jgi:hypothetical protein